MANVTPAGLQQMRQNRDQLMQKADQSRLNAQQMQQKSDQMRQALPVKPSAPPMPVNPAPRAITDPVQPTPTPSPAPMPAVRGPFNAPDGNFDASKAPPLPPGAVYKKGGKVKKMASGGMTSKSSSSPASRRGDGIAQRGKTKGRMC